MLRLFALLAVRCLQGLAHAVAVPQFYEDLRDSSYETTFAIFHQRYSTNTQPSWHLAQPFRYVAHNGEINTIVSNRRWLRAKERRIRNDLAVGPWFNALEQNVSDSASFDNGFEVKLLQGFSPEEAMLAMRRRRLRTIHFFRAMCVQRFRRFRCTASRGMVRQR